MSVIMGLNLSDRIYLFADSRVSYKDEKTGEIIIKHDNMLKIEPLDKLVDCYIASAGDARFAQFIIKNLNKDFPGANITKLRTEIVDWAKEQAHVYFQRYNTLANFIIAGVDENKKKSIEKQKFTDVLNAYSHGEPVAGSMKSLISDAINKAKPEDKELILNVNNEVLFSLRISGAGVFDKDAQWGEVLLSGPEGITKEDIADHDIGRFEFEYEQNIHNNIERDSVLLVAILNSLIEEKNLPSVGGSLVPFCLTHNKLFATTPRAIYSTDLDGKDVRFINAYSIEGGRFYRLDEKDTKYRMHRVSEIKFKDVKPAVMLTI